MNAFLKYISACGLLVLAMRYCDAASGPAVVPGKKNVLLTGFSGDMFPQANATLPTIGQWFSNVGYNPPTIWIRTQWNPKNPPLPTGNSGYYTIDDFKGALAAGNLGVLFSVGHAGNAGIAVEHFATQADLDARFDNLTNGGPYSVKDIFAFPDAADNEFTIAITSNFVNDDAVQFAPNGFVYASGCSSFVHFNRNGNDFAHPSIPLLDSSVRGAIFLGMPAICRPSYHVSDYLAFFGSMLGQTPIPNLGQGNASALDGLLFANTKVTAPGEPTAVLASAGNDPTLAKRYRFYLAARIIRAGIKEAGVDIYRYAYTDQAYPFTNGDYPGDLSHAAVKPATSGNLSVTLTFSQSMDTAWSGFNVQLAPQGGAPPVSFSAGAWSKTNSDNDTWTGTLTIPQGASDLDGTATLIVTARDIYQANSTTGGLDIDGTGVAQGSNRMISFTTDLTPPRLTVLEGARVVSQEGPGVAAATGTSSGAGVTIVAHDLAADGASEGSGLAKLVLLQNGQKLAESDTPFSGAHTYTAADLQNKLALLDPGAYTVQAFDMAGNKTEAAFYVLPSLAVFDALPDGTPMRVRGSSDAVVDGAAIDASAVVYVASSTLGSRRRRSWASSRPTVPRSRTSGAC